MAIAPKAAAPQSPEPSALVTVQMQSSVSSAAQVKQSLRRSHGVSLVGHVPLVLVAQRTPPAVHVAAQAPRLVVSLVTVHTQSWPRSVATRQSEQLAALEHKFVSPIQHMVAAVACVTQLLVVQAGAHVPKALPALPALQTQNRPFCEAEVQLVHVWSGLEQPARGSWRLKKEAHVLGVKTHEVE